MSALSNPWEMRNINQLSTFLIVSPASRVAMRTQLFTMIPLAKIMCNVVMEMNR
jgi:hypothetical protein